jgi:hypothetical protein
MKDQLQSLLQSWTERRRPADGHLDDLRRRIRSAALQPVRRATAEEFVLLTIPLAWKLRYAAAGALVVLALSVVCVRFLAPTGGPARAPGSAEALATVSDREIETGRRLFGEMELLFADRLRWVAESNGDMGLGVESLPGGAPQDAAAVLVRLVIAGRKADEAVWRPVWRVDVLLRGSELVQIVPNARADNALTLWVYPMADGKVAVDTALSLKAPVEVSSSGGCVVDQGKPSEVLSLRAGDTEYRVLETVRTLGAGKRASLGEVRG